MNVPGDPRVPVEQRVIGLTLMALGVIHIFIGLVLLTAR